MSRKNVYALAATGFVWVLSTVALALVALEGHHQIPPLPAWVGSLLFPFLSAAVPGPLLLGIAWQFPFRQLPDSLLFFSLLTIAGLLLNAVLYWLLFRGIIGLFVLAYGKAYGQRKLRQDTP